MKSLLRPVAVLVFAFATVGCSRSETPSAEALSAPTTPTAVVVDAGSEGPARALGLKLGFAFTTNLMGELEPCG